MRKLFLLYSSLYFAIITNAQNVGIGTTTPQAKLEVNGTLNTPSVPNTSSSGVFRLAGSGNGGLDFGIHTVPWMQAGFGGVPADISLQALGGKVGIGTATPQYLLHIKSPDDAVHAIDAGATGAAWNYYLQNGTLRSAIGWSNINSALSFYVNGADRMVINNNGNVGIGLNAPDALLHLHKATNPMLLLTNTSSGATINDGSAIWLSGNNLMIDNVENGDIIFNTNYAERLRVTSNGNVGIGSNNPTATLDVNGTVKIADGTQGTGKVLTSDANGNAGWQETSAGQVAFMAFRKPSSGNTTTSYSITLFDSTSYNVGNAYDPVLCEFTAPSSGLYCFYGQAGFEPSTTIYLGWVEFFNPADYSTFRTIQQDIGGTSSLYKSIGVSAMYFLNSGDKIKFQVGIGDNHHVTYNRAFTFMYGYKVK